MKNVILFFGSFNPVHKGHIALAEYVVEQGLCDEVVLVVSPQNPLKPSRVLASEMDRFEMAEIACAASKYPDRIKASVVEFLLKKPSYTINTLRYLKDNFGSQMHFSLLMGEDLLDQLDQWREYTEILDNYPIYIYPRHSVQATHHLDRITMLSDAPRWNLSATEIREKLERGEDAGDMLAEGVAAYIDKKRLWTPANRIVTLTAHIEAEADNATLYVERGKCYYQHNEWGNALNDFNHALKLNPEYGEAQQFAEMVQEILAFRYKDIYNP